ncbi:MAG: phage tail tape measure protein, partial [Bacteroidetes bacterium GWB2_41_8]
MSQNETAKATIYLDGKQAEAAIDALKTKSKELKVQFEAAKKAGDNITMKKLENEIRSVDAASRSLIKDSFDVERVLKKINKVSWRDLEKAQKTVVSEMKRMERGTEAYAAKTKNLEKITEELNRTRGVLKQKESVWGRLADGANKYFNMITLGIATFTGMAFSAAQFIKGMVGLDDALANVQKTTELTRKEVKEMYVDFRNLNTRTPRAELLLLAEEAGRLGRKGKKDIMDFVEVANKIKISLGDDLGGNPEKAIKEVGKLTEIYRIGEQYGTDFKTSMEKVGSGINEVANNSNASAEYLIEYMKRLGGISTQARITAADIMGYASTYDQLGQNVEMAATAQSKVIVDMFSDPAKYARIAKMEVAAFSNLLNTDANEAFIRFLEGLNGNNEGLSVMATKLDGLGIDGARATQALAALSSNTKMLREQQALANDSMREGTSLQNEYAIKNKNLAGSWAKLTAFIHSQFINSGFLGFLESSIGKLSKMTEVTHPLTKAMKDEVTQVNLLSIELTNSNTPAERRNEIYAELKRIAPDVVANIDVENISISKLRGNLEKYNAEMIKKLALQDSEETLADKREAAGNATNDRIEKELKLQKEMNSLLQTYKTFDPKIAREMEDILFSSETTLNKYKKIVATVGNVNFSPKTSEALTEALKDEKKATDDVTESLKAYMERYEMVFGKGKSGAVPPPPPPPTSPGGSVIPVMDAEQQKAASAKGMAAIEAAHNTRMSLLTTQYETEKWSKVKFEQEQYDMELVFLVQKKAMLTVFGQETNDIDKQINENRVKALESRNAKMLEKEKEFNNLMDAADKDYLKQTEDNSQTEEAILKNSFDAITDSINDSLDDLDDAKKRENDILEERARNYQMISETIVGSLSSMLDGSLDEYATYGDALVLMALQILKQMAPIWAAQIVGGSLATPDSIITGGATGVIKFTAMLALMEGFISIAEAGVKKGIEKKRDAATGSKQ